MMLAPISRRYAALHVRAIAFYNRRIVLGWYRKWSTWAMAAAIVLPDGVQLLLDHLDILSVAIPQLDPVTKERLRLVLIALAFVLRLAKQKEPRP